jgi:hypothetical protein
MIALALLPAPVRTEELIDMLLRVRYNLTTIFACRVRAWVGLLLRGSQCLSAMLVTWPAVALLQSGGQELAAVAREGLLTLRGEQML